MSPKCWQFPRQKTIFPKICADKRVCRLPITCPLSENRRSDGTDVAGTARYLRANSGRLALRAAHHFKGSWQYPIASIPRYCWTSFLGGVLLFMNIFTMNDNE